MIVSLIHLSDIHLRSGHNVIIKRSTKVFDAIKNELLGKDRIVILISGDIAFSGKYEEYVIAKTFLKTLYDKIKDYSGLEVDLIVVPGNHDCDFDEKKEEIRQILLGSIREKEYKGLNNNTIEACLTHQKPFFDFKAELRKLGLNSSTLILNNPLLTIEIVNCGDFSIKFNLYNSSWDSGLKEKIGNMHYPIDIIEKDIPAVDANLTISIIHHPLNWQNAMQSKALREFLLRTSDFTLSGHEHEGNNILLKDLENDYNYIHIESPALQDSENEKTSAFNLIDIDTSLERVKINRYTYSSERNIYETDANAEWKPIEKQNKFKTSPIKIKASFEKILNDPGAKFSHTKVDEIFLKDIYVYPYLKHISLDKDTRDKLYRYESARIALLQISEIEIAKSTADRKCFRKLILGNESSGKTSLLKTIYLEYYLKGLYPIYISVDKINDITVDKIKKIIGREFKNQYDELEVSFESIDFKKAIILIDDFHKFKNQAEKVIFIGNLCKVFDNIIITGNELMLFESYTNKQNITVELYDGFETYIIQEFNPSLRHDLIKKWYRLGVEYISSEEKNNFLKKLDDVSGTVSSIIGKNYLPAYPVFVLTVLQGLETGESDATGNKLHAYYYQLLITNSLRKILKDKDEIGLYITLAKEYFYFLFDNKIRFSPLSKDSFIKFLNYHKTNYKISKLNDEEVIRTLTESSIIRITTEGEISIAYKYLYYYFVALYLADHIEEDEIRSKIDLMADRVYRDEYSNIIVFLIHLTRTPYVIGKLIEKSRGIFGFINPVKIEDDVVFVNELQKSLPERVLANITVEDARDEELLNEDEVETLEKENEHKSFSEDYDLNEDSNSIDIISQLTRSLRTISILGQLAKKYWGELKGNQKYDLAEEAVMLGLRTLMYEFNLLENSSESLIEHIKRIVQRKFAKQHLESEDIKKVSENFLFNLACSAGFGVLKRVVNAIGTEKLSDTFGEIEEKYPYNSVQIVNLGIRLDHYSGYPLSELEALKKANEGNPIGFAIIQNFVMDNLYMFNHPIERKQQICELVNIRLQDQRAIQLTSKVRKS